MNQAYYEDIFSKNNIPLFSINISGVYGFFFNNITTSESNLFSQIDISPFDFGQKLKKLTEKMAYTTSKKSKKRFKREYLMMAICLLEDFQKKYPKEIISKVEDSEYFHNNESVKILEEDVSFKVVETLK